MLTMNRKRTFTLLAGALLAAAGNHVHAMWLVTHLKAPGATNTAGLSVAGGHEIGAASFGNVYRPAL
jgi:hypothetical protein